MKRPAVLLSFIVAAVGGFLLGSAMLPYLNPQIATAAPFSEVSPASAVGVARPPINNASDLASLIIEDDYHATQTILWETLQVMDPAAVGKLAKELSLMPRGDSERERASRTVWERWAQLDLASAEAFFPAITNEQVKLDAGNVLINRLAVKDTARAERLIALTQTPGGDRSFADWAKGNLLNRLAVDRPEEAARKFTEPFYSKGTFGMTSAQHIAQQWANKNPAAAFAWAQSLPDDRGREAAIASVFSVQLKKDSAAAVNMFNSSPEEQRPQLIATLAEAWPQEDAAGALEWVKSFPDPLQRAKAWEGYLKARIREDSAAAARELQTLPETERETLRYKVLEDLRNSPYHPFGGKGNLSNPLDLLRDAAPGAMLEAERAVKVIQSINPGSRGVETLRWALELGRDDASLAAAGTVLYSALVRNPDEVPQQITAIENPDRRLPLQEKLAAHWATADFPAAEAWMHSLPAGEQFAVREAILQAAKPEEAAPLLFETLQTDPTAANDPAWRRSVTQIYIRWAGQDPSAAAASAQTLPLGENRAEALQQVNKRWREFNAADAKMWIEGLAPEDRAALQNPTGT